MGRKIPSSGRGSGQRPAPPPPPSLPASSTGGGGGSAGGGGGGGSGAVPGPSLALALHPTVRPGHLCSLCACPAGGGPPLLVCGGSVAGCGVVVHDACVGGARDPRRWFCDRCCVLKQKQSIILERQRAGGMRNMFVFVHAHVQWVWGWGLAATRGLVCGSFVCSVIGPVTPAAHGVCACKCGLDAARPPLCNSPCPPRGSSCTSLLGVCALPTERGEGPLELPVECVLCPAKSTRAVRVGWFFVFTPLW